MLTKILNFFIKDFISSSFYKELVNFFKKIISAKHELNP